jgi:gluconokinase
MGVAGAGKSTLAAALAARLGWPFLEADDLHPPANVAKMRSGQPLDDADRAPWLDAIAGWIAARVAGGEPGVVACSALKRRYRDRLRTADPGLRTVFVDGDAKVIADRIAHRHHRYWPQGLLPTQFADLERPAADEAAVVVDLARPTAVQVDAALAGLGLA